MKKNFSQVSSVERVVTLKGNSEKAEDPRRILAYWEKDKALFRLYHETTKWVKNFF